MNSIKLEKLATLMIAIAEVEEKRRKKKVLKECRKCIRTYKKRTRTQKEY